MKKYKMILIVFLVLGVTLKLHAQITDNSSLPTIHILQGNNEYNTSLSQSWTKNELDDRIIVPTEIGYYFKISEPMNTVLKFSNLVYLEQSLSREDCSFISLRITIHEKDASLYNNFYRLNQEISVDSLEHFFYTDSINFIPGEYLLELHVLEGTTIEEEFDSNISKRRNMPSNLLSPIDPDLPVDPDIPIDPGTPIEPLPLLYREYSLSATLKTRNLFPLESKLPNIPIPSSTSFHSLSAFPEKNMVCIFESMDGGVLNGNLNLNYYDDLGRLVQKVKQKSSPKLMDMVTLQEYDSWGRKSKLWMPTVANQDSGTYIQAELYKKQARETYEGDNHPYISFVYENSPLEKIIQQNNPGDDWYINNKSVKMKEYTNIARNDTLNCLSFQFEDGYREALTITSGNQYPDGSLFVIRTEDEDGNASFEFRDRSGKLVLMRKVESDIHGKQLFDSYYIYDGLNQLRAVLPPKLTDQITAGDIPSTLLYHYAYLYKYDKLGNQLAKKLPGIGWTYYVYDKNSRLIFSQNSIEKEKKEWKFFISDVFGRLCLQGICKNQIDPFKEEYQNNSFICQYVGIASLEGYNLNQNEHIETFLTDPIIHIVNYYDNYNFIYQNKYPSKTEFNYLEEEGFQGSSFNARGLLTGTLIMNLKDDEDNKNPEYNWTVMYYDDRSRILQTVSNNHLRGMERNSYAYDFTGNIVKHRHRHSASGKASLNELYLYSYDSAKRLKQVTHKLNNNPEVKLSVNDYDELGRLKKTAFHNEMTSASFEYNVRNWLTQISNPLFHQNLYYTNGTGIPCYNGNISSMTWKANSPTSKGYRFTYDGLSRMKDAIYGEGENLGTNPNAFNEQVIGYDKNGNIVGLKRFGRTSASDYGLIDNLSMNYEGNQLKDVKDGAISNAYADDFEFKSKNEKSVEYIYDANGNLKQNLDKNITDIQYNFLNLPNRIQFTDGSSTSYLYSADGVKLQTTHIIEGITTTTDYCGGVIYENGVLKQVLTEVGYITFNGENPTYHYFLKDHQGNNRIVIDQTGKVEEVNNYYPFGGVFAEETSVQAYKYNGKELDRKNGLDWYDYGARMYDVALGRWHAVDPMSEKYYEMSPYGYCANNPINFIDPNGKWIVGTDGKRVTYNTKTGWSKNASKDVQRAGNSLLKTETGTKRLNYMLGYDEKISITVSSEVIKEGKALTMGMNKRKNTKVTKNGQVTVGEHEITIYEGSIKEAIKENSGAKGYAGLNVEDAIGAVVGHESGHTEKQNTKQSLENNKTQTIKNDVEKHPNEIESKILEELKKKE